MSECCTSLELRVQLPVTAQNGGLFLSRGKGSHPVRIIDSHELIVVRRGVLEMFEEEERFRLSPGQALILVPGRRHGGAAPYPPDLAFFWVHFAVHPDALLAAAGMLFPVPRCSAARDPEKLDELCLRLLDEQETRGPGGLSLSILLLAILAELARGDGGRRPAADVNALAARAAEWVKLKALTGDCSTSRAARELRCNPDYLGRLFREAYGHGITEAAQAVRIKHARRLLLERSLGVKEVATACAFGDVAFFRKVFRRHTGVSPAAFRRLHGHLHTNTE